MQEVRGSTPRLGGSRAGPFQVSGGIYIYIYIYIYICIGWVMAFRHPAIKGLRPP